MIADRCYSKDTAGHRDDTLKSRDGDPGLEIAESDNAEFATMEFKVTEIDVDEITQTGFIFRSIIETIYQRVTVSNRPHGQKCAI
jgi:hypothetical protein